MFLILPCPLPASQQHIPSPLPTRTATILVRATATSHVDDWGRTLKRVPGRTLTLGPPILNSRPGFGKLEPEQERLLCPKACSGWLPAHPTEHQRPQRGLKRPRVGAAGALTFTDSLASSLARPPAQPIPASLFSLSGHNRQTPTRELLLQRLPGTLSPRGMSGSFPRPSRRSLPGPPCVGSSARAPAHWSTHMRTHALHQVSRAQLHVFLPARRCSCLSTARRDSATLSPSASASTCPRRTRAPRTRVSAWFTSVFQKTGQIPVMKTHGIIV